jgi:hypothetical protein
VCVCAVHASDCQTQSNIVAIVGWCCRMQPQCSGAQKRKNGGYKVGTNPIHKVGNLKAHKSEKMSLLKLFRVNNRVKNVLAFSGSANCAACPLHLVGGVTGSS